MPHKEQVKFVKAFLNKLPDTVQSKIVAHRGFHCQHDTLERPIENTLEAFETAWKNGITLCECDVTITTDGKIIFGHDETFERLALIKDEIHKSDVEKLSSNELQNLKLIDNSTALYLQDIINSLNTIKGSKLVVEIKHTADKLSITKRLLELLQKLKEPKSSIPIIMSFKATTNFQLQKYLTANLASNKKPDVLLLIKKVSSDNQIQHLKEVNPDFHVPQVEIDLNDISCITYIKKYFLKQDDIELDGLYLQFDEQMLVEGRVRSTIKTMCLNFIVGVWLGQTDRKYDQLKNIIKLEEIGVSYVNSDYPQHGFFE